MAIWKYGNHEPKLICKILHSPWDFTVFFHVGTIAKTHHFPIIFPPESAMAAMARRVIGVHGQFRLGLLQVRFKPRWYHGAWWRGSHRPPWQTSPPFLAMKPPTNWGIWNHITPTKQEKSWNMRSSNDLSHEYIMNIMDLTDHSLGQTWS